MPIIIILVVLLFFWFGVQNQNQCDGVESLAQNPEVVRALDQWALENIVDNGYYFVNGMHGRIAAYKNESEEIVYIELPNSEVTGIEDQRFRFSILKHNSEHTDPIISSNVHSVYFGRGRDSIIITKNGHVIETYRGSDLKSGSLKKIGESVYAYCSTGSFRM